MTTTSTENAAGVGAEGAHASLDIVLGEIDR